MRYVEGTNQELLTVSPQFPALVIAHQGFDKARLHWHEGFEVIYIRRCRATVVRDNRRTMHHAGDVVVVPPRSLHSIELLPESLNHQTPQALSVTISPTELMPMYPYISAMQQNLNYTDIEIHSHNRLEECCERIFTALTEGASHRFLEANAWFYLMLNEIFSPPPFESYAVSAPYASESMPEDERRSSADHELQEGRIVQRVRKYIQHHYAEALSSTTVAQRFGYSREHLSRMFSAYSGMTLKEYTTRVRLLIACDLLANTDMPITQVVKESGFPSTQTMRCAFSRQIGCTPSQYRSRARA